ncbi:MAG: hypothetical protein JJT78_02240 [Leptospira sp.]|nr:hypothetical protein [Leptospira sp.]
MKRNELIENLIQDKADNTSTRLSNFLFYGILFLIISVSLYFNYFRNFAFSFPDLLIGISTILFFIFFKQYYHVGANIRYLYYSLAIILYSVWIIILAMDSVSEINEFGFPKGWQCLAEIIFIGIVFGIFLKKTLIPKNTILNVNSSWISFVVAIGMGFFLINELCIIPESSHDLIWHGMFPFFLAVWIFFRKL